MHLHLTSDITLSAQYTLLGKCHEQCLKKWLKPFVKLLLLQCCFFFPVKRMMTAKDSQIVQNPHTLHMCSKDFYLLLNLSARVASSPPLLSGSPLDDWWRVSETCSPAFHASGRDYMPVCGVCIDSVSLCWTVCDHLHSWVPLIKICGFVANHSGTRPFASSKVKQERRGHNQLQLKLPGGLLSFCCLQGELSITSSVCSGLKSSLLSAQLLQANPQTLDGS